MYSNDLILKILDYLDLNINKQISITELSIKFFFNKDYIMRLFKKEIGMTIIEYVNTKRIFNSLVNLKDTNYSMIRIALNSGFSSLEYFSETFSKIMGVSPSAYKAFIKAPYNAKQDNYLLIISNFLFISQKMDTIKKYKTHIKPSENKKLTLFKNHKNLVLK
jgi:AraC-like DNA-binding protein